MVYDVAFNPEAISSEDVSGMFLCKLSWIEKLPLISRHHGYNPQSSGVSNDQSLYNSVHSLKSCGQAIKGKKTIWK